MRTLRRVTLFVVLLTAAVLWAADTPKDKSRSSTSGTLTRDANGDYQFVLKLQPEQRSFQAPSENPFGNLVQLPSPERRRMVTGAFNDYMARRNGTCYTIRRYERKRVDRTDETVPGEETVCTPSSRVRARPAAPRK